jgi:hypothetical protein
VRFFAALAAALLLHLQPHAPAPTVDYAASYVYYMRSLPADEQIRIEFAGTPVVDKMLYFASRESMGDTVAPYSFDCAAHNKHSSAAGLFQTMRTQGRLDTLAALGFTWADVAGPDCLADVTLARALYDACGLGPWSPPRYSCHHP